MAIGIESTYTRNTCITNICVVSTWIRYFGIRNACIRDISTISTFVEDINPRELVGSEIIFNNPSINNYCLSLMMGLIFTLIDGISYWGIGKLDSHLRIIHAIYNGYILLYL